ncbi:MAG: hypothetical protein HQL94_03085 [Magnetococcales bacterium]|nr:hypothetical protein [Magnetococcales bacterium]MBF0437607.1 hypothetical protein [Magnetococcales bacterium]
MSTEMVAQILSRLERRTADRLLAHLNKHQSELARAVRDKMVLFEDLYRLDDRGLQALLRELPTEILIIALQGASMAMVTRCCQNLSQQAGEDLRSNLIMTVHPNHKVESARKVMLDVARTLDHQGILILPSRANNHKILY